MLIKNGKVIGGGSNPIIRAMARMEGKKIVQEIMEAKMKKFQELPPEEKSKMIEDQSGPIQIQEMNPSIAFKMQMNSILKILDDIIGAANEMFEKSDGYTSTFFVPKDTERNTIAMVMDDDELSIDGEIWEKRMGFLTDMLVEHGIEEELLNNALYYYKQNFGTESCYSMLNVDLEGDE